MGYFGHVENWLDRFFPEYAEVFKDWEEKASLIMLGEFSTPSEIVGLGVEAIVQRWKKDVKRAVGAKRAEQLMETAKIHRAYQRTLGSKNGN